MKLILFLLKNEFVDGVLENNDSDRRCLLFIRDLDYNNDENIKKKLIENKFYDKIEIDKIELENLKKKIKEKLPAGNVATLKVIQNSN